MWFIKMGVGEGGSNKKGYVKYIKIFIWEGVLINENGRNVWQFFLRIGTALPLPPHPPLHPQHYIFEELSIYI